MKQDDSLLVEGIEKRICMKTEEPGTIRAMDIPEDIYEIFTDSMG